MATVGKENRGPAGPKGPQALPIGELKMMLGQCLKMASENKITASNTWGLPLIEHLDDLIKEDDPATRHTNFQRASVTLDAGVKIYSYRVDSVHTETFKMLGGLGRASGPGEDGADGDPGDGGVDAAASPSKRRRRVAEANPEATLEASLDALNVKKFDLAFAVDPLFHKTSAQFDEGGAKGLLLNNLSVYRGCDIVFDSMDVPDAAMEAAEAAAPAGAAAVVDLEAVRPAVEAVLARAVAAAGGPADRISPTLDDILALLGAAPGDGAAAQAQAFVRSVAEGAPVVCPDAIVPARSPSPGAETAPMEADGEGGVAPEAYAPPAGADGDHNEYAAADDFGGYDGGYDDFDDCGDMSEQQAAGFNASGDGQSNNTGGGLIAEPSAALQEDAINWLIAAGNGSGTYVTGYKGWAGASHWRYRAVPGAAGGGRGGAGGADAEVDSEDEEEYMPAGAKKRRNKRNEPLDFVALMAEGVQEPTFETAAPGAGRRRRAKPAAAKTLLPEDHHYAAESLARYALRPRTAVAFVAGNGSGAGFGGAGASQHDDFADFGAGAGMDDDEYDGGDAYGGEFDFGAFAEGGEGEGGVPHIGDALELAQASHRVEKVEVNYSRAAKQVDVRSLKELMWSGIQQVTAAQGADADSPIEFADILATVPANNDAGRLEDLSVHLCFICVLHLANEHGLVVRGVPGLDRLQVSNVPAAA